MPIYEYHCNMCRNEFEILVLPRDTPGCPECGSRDLSRHMSRCGFVSRTATPGGHAQVSSAPSACGSCSATSCATCGSR